MIKQQMQGMNKATPTQQSNFHVVVCRMQQQPYRAMRQPAAQLHQGQVWQVQQGSRIC